MLIGILTIEICLLLIAKMAACEICNSFHKLSVIELTVRCKYCAQHQVNVSAGNGLAGKAPDSRVTNPSSSPDRRNT